jgi:Holliday junction resolvase-like predicted endonuclease
MEITKSGRFTRIIGNFGENIVCNWLSRSGFEVALVDHTGIDIVAYHHATRDRLGITVKSRTRLAGSEKDSVNLFSYQRGKDDRQKVLDAC